MENPENKSDEINWELTTWEGARREAMRRWSQMPLEQLIAALEEMENIYKSLSQTTPASSTTTTDK